MLRAVSIIVNGLVYAMIDFPKIDPQLSFIFKKRERFWNYISCNYDVILKVELFNKLDVDFVNCILGGNLEFFQNNLQGHLKFITSYAAISYVKL